MMDTMLKDRWYSSAENRKAFKRICNIVNSDGVITSDLTPFGMYQGRSDFRGIDLSRIKMYNITFKNIDFAESTWNSAWIENCTFENANFEKADLTHVRDRGNEFRICSFITSRLVGAAIGYLGSKYIRCGFIKTNFQHAIFIRAEYDDCVFNDCKMKGIDFNASSFVECIFSGEIRDVWFRGGYALEYDEKEFGKARHNNMKNVSFENATLLDLTFSNDCDLSSVILPKFGNYRLFSDWKNKLQNLKNKIKDWPTDQQKEAEIFVNTRLRHAKAQNYYILNVDALADKLGSVLSEKIVEGLCVSG